MNLKLKPSGEVHLEHQAPPPVEWHPSGTGLEAPRFVMARAEPVAAITYPGVVEHPLANPTVTGTTFSIDVALQNPTTVLTPMIIDLTLTKFFVDRVFGQGGTVTGGAVLYNVVAGNDLYAARDVQMVAPGAEFPIVTFERRVPQVAVPEKWGGKFAFEWEARDRNATTEFTNAMRQLANTIVRKINQRGVQVLDALITTYSRTVAGNNWTTVVTTGSSASNHTLWPARDFGKIVMLEEQEELGIEHRLWIMNPLDYANLASIYGDALDALLDSFNVDIFVTNRVASGTAYVVAEGQVGEIRLEAPLTTRTWDDPDGIEQTWVQSSVRPLFFANNPFAVFKVTGLS